jgi:hypothetical protein
LLAVGLSMNPIKLAYIIACAVIASIQIGIAIYDYKKVIREGKIAKRVLDFLLTLSLISAGITLASSIVGIPYRAFLSIGIVIFVNLGINLFGITYDFADILSSIIGNYRMSAFRKLRIV